MGAKLKLSHHVILMEWELDFVIHLDERIDSIERI